MYIIDDEKRIIDAGITKEQFDKVMTYVLGKIEEGEGGAENEKAVCTVDIANNANEICTVTYRNEAGELTIGTLESVGHLRINVAIGTEISISSRGRNEMSLSGCTGGVKCVVEDWIDTKQMFKFAVDGDGGIQFER